MQPNRAIYTDLDTLSRPVIVGRPVCIASFIFYFTGYLGSPLLWLYIIRDDIQAAAGPHQLCAGQIAGIEAAVHAVRSCSISHDNNDAILLVISDLPNLLVS